MTQPETLLSLRKQMLLSRAALERAEMVRSVGLVRQSTQRLRHQLPGMALGTVGKNLPVMLSLFRRLRLLAPLVPVLMGVVRKPLLRYSVLGAAGALLVALAGRRWLGALFSSRTARPD